MAHGFQYTKTLLSGMIFQNLFSYLPEASQGTIHSLENTGFEHLKPAVNLLLDSWRSSNLPLEIHRIVKI